MNPVIAGLIAFAYVALVVIVFEWLFRKSAKGDIGMVESAIVAILSALAIQPKGRFEGAGE